MATVRVTAAVTVKSVNGGSDSGRDCDCDNSSGDGCRAACVPLVSVRGNGSGCRSGTIDNSKKVTVMDDNGAHR